MHSAQEARWVHTSIFSQRMIKRMRTESSIRHFSVHAILKIAKKMRHRIIMNVLEKLLRFRNNSATIFVNSQPVARRNGIAYLILTYGIELQLRITFGQCGKPLS